MVLSEKIARIVRRALNENVQSFTNFMVQEYGRQVTKTELGQAIIGWADLYMQGANSGDFENVGKYVDQGVYTDIVDSLPQMFVDELLPHAKFNQDGEEETQAEDQ